MLILNKILELKIEPILKKGMGFLFSRLTTCASRLRIEDTGFCLKAFSLRSLGAVCNADPLTSRPGGLILELARGAAVIGQLKVEGGNQIPIDI